jgi:hypothetical protein
MNSLTQGLEEAWATSPVLVPLVMTPGQTHDDGEALPGWDLAAGTDRLSSLDMVNQLLIATGSEETPASRIDWRASWRRRQTVAGWKNDRRRHDTQSSPEHGQLQA